MKNESSSWVLTDDDSRQHVKRINDWTYSLIEMGLISRNPDQFEVYTDTIDLQDDVDLMSSEITGILDGFGYVGYFDVAYQYGQDAPQIVAECIFESYGSFRADVQFVGSEEECIEYIDQYIKQ